MSDLRPLCQGKGVHRLPMNDYMGLCVARNVMPKEACAGPLPKVTIFDLVQIRKGPAAAPTEHCGRIARRFVVGQLTPWAPNTRTWCLVEWEEPYLCTWGLEKGTMRTSGCGMWFHETHPGLTAGLIDLTEAPVVKKRGRRVAQEEDDVA